MLYRIPVSQQEGDQPLASHANDDWTRSETHLRQVHGVRRTLTTMTVAAAKLVMVTELATATEVSVTCRALNCQDDIGSIGHLLLFVPVIAFAAGAYAYATSYSRLRCDSRCCCVACCDTFYWIDRILDVDMKSWLDRDHEWTERYRKRLSSRW